MGLGQSYQIEAEECQNPHRVYIAGINRRVGVVVRFRPRCKQWSCPVCAQINRRVWAHRAAYGAEVLESQGAPLSFLTLTSHRKLSAEQTIWVLKRAWPTLYKRVRRLDGDFSYFLVPERHKNGRVHLHAIIKGRLGTRWWKDNAAATGLGYICKEIECDSPGAASQYVAKYIGKQLDGQSWPSRFRRVRRTRNWPKEPPKEPSPDWEWRVATSWRKAEELISPLMAPVWTSIWTTEREAYATIQAIEGVPWAGALDKRTK